MKYLYIIIFLSINLFSNEIEKTKYITVEERKERFYTLLVPAIKKVHFELKQQHKNIFWDIFYERNANEISKLKKKYKVKTDRELLVALKPHQISITLAQAAMESSWATSRFFTLANNVFGIWSINSKEPRIAALQERKENQTIWLKKFNSIEDSVRGYYMLLGRARAYAEFRKVRYQNNNVYELIKKLDSYSELDEQYTNELASMIKYNNLTKYD
ncbi:MAG: glucosaminidase domain-containing protein [Sulfurimonas sp.]|nr:glucosaminidase domain-containing protein [Sulfurimonas sp.]